MSPLENVGISATAAMDRIDFSKMWGMGSALGPRETWEGRPLAVEAVSCLLWKREAGGSPCNLSRTRLNLRILVSIIMVSGYFLLLIASNAATPMITAPMIVIW